MRLIWIGAGVGRVAAVAPCSGFDGKVDGTTGADGVWAKLCHVARANKQAVTECRARFNTSFAFRCRCAASIVTFAVLCSELDAGQRSIGEGSYSRFTLVPMRVFGIDCGTEFTGYGVVEVDSASRNPKLRHLCAGAVKLNKKDRTPVRLLQVYVELSALLQLWQPEVVAIEEVFFSANAKSALKLGQVRGVAMMAAASCGLLVAEYAPLTIKSSVVGYGLAAKEQVQFMVARLLDLAEAPKPADAADALAIAICHIHHAQTEEHMRR